MRLLLLNPWAWLIAVAGLALSVGGGYRWGHTAAATSCAAKAGGAVATLERKEDTRDANIEAIATATAAATAAALHDNRGSSNESSERIRNVYVPGDCRAVDPGIVRELREAGDGINATLGAGMRPVAAGPGAADP